MGKMLLYKRRPAHVDLQGSLAPWHTISVRPCHQQPKLIVTEQEVMAC